MTAERKAKHREKFVPVMENTEAIKRAPEGWLTMSALSQYLDADTSWIYPKLAELQFTCRYYFDKQGISRVHFPPEVIETLEEMREPIKQKKDSGPWTPFHALYLLGKEQTNKEDSAGRFRTAYQLFQGKTFTLAELKIHQLRKNELEAWVSYQLVKADNLNLDLANCVFTELASTVVARIEETERLVNWLTLVYEPNDFT